MSIRVNIIIQKHVKEKTEYTQIYCGSGGLPEIMGKDLKNFLTKFKDYKNKDFIFASTESLANALHQERQLYEIELITTNVDEIDLCPLSDFIYIIDMDEQCLHIKEFISKDLHDYIVQHEQGNAPANLRFYDDWDEWKTKSFSSIFYEAYELDKVNY
jgi:fructose-1-phosphate kinase PfkB-like protein